MELVSSAAGLRLVEDGRGRGPRAHPWGQRRGGQPLQPRGALPARARRHGRERGADRHRGLAFFSEELKAAMDYAMAAFDVEAVAVPRNDCSFRQTSNSAILVEPGGFRIEQVFADSAKDPSGVAVSYSLNVSRLTGNETILHWVHIEGSFLLPDWDSRSSVYTVYLTAEQDYAKFTFQRGDNGQSVWVDAAQEGPMHAGTGRRLASEHGEGRRHAAPRGLQSAAFPSAEYLPPVGEVQRTPTTVIVPVDVGNERLVDLVVKSANGKKSGKYRFFVSRPYCPEDRRFFDPKAKVCTETCDEGYFGNTATGRCSRCLNRGCSICDKGLGCQMCLQGFELQSDGFCKSGAGSPGSLESMEKAEVHAAVNYGRSHVGLVLAMMSAGSIGLCLFLVVHCCGGGGACDLLSGKLGDEDDDDDFRTPYSTAREYYGTSHREGLGPY
eukprot:CAMPEP_0177501694 /NCGR_PEP_ID=MMETSP0369-20130122/37371_1 /TAXON_ID=447022 ORGANISM="Scrippsiella hangoei-like, Strain SHHI-4" /NCGR_SAMPLE_ID=MMETSP0369 /ASSEMBLY_ACC=CAM_ASM_000364 /LENGTH=439 /DNA_ID=CAMNT_0018979237 /DNA_START=1 /DNA_END=1321 /DNA_ORIENTATION=-